MFDDREEGQTGEGSRQQQSSGSNKGFGSNDNGGRQ